MAYSQFSGRGHIHRLGRAVVTLTYKGAHSRLFYVRGKASQHQCIDCSKQALDWSHIHGTDPDNPDNYEPRCRSCHLTYDHIGAGRTDRVGELNGRAKLSESDVREIRKMLANGVFQHRIAHIFDVSQAAIMCISTGRTWTHVKD